MKAVRIRKVIWPVILLAAGAIHFGASAFRFNAFAPPLQLLDFSSYYAAAYSTRLNVSPYPLSPDLQNYLAKTQNLPDRLPSFNSAPLWAWLLQPLAGLPFQSAAVLWLMILAAILLLCHVLLVEIAGYKGWKIILATLPITITFGPMFLNLTLGQNAVVLLLCALVMGRILESQSKYGAILWIPLWIIAVAGKIFPLLWIGCPGFLKRPRMLAIAAGFCLAAFLGIAWLKPAISNAYWRHYIFSGAQQYIRRSSSIDDQSLKAFLGRIARSRRINVHGLNVNDRRTVDWNLPWEFSNQSVYLVSAAIVVSIGMWLLYSWVRSRNRSPAGELFSLLLFTLIFFPHMQRYNHLLALPALAWLWRRGIWGRKIAITGYALFALSRLNHIWASFLPSVPAAVASGFGLFAVLLLFSGVTYSFWMIPREERSGIASIQ